MNKYGYGWAIDTVAGKKTFGHGGGIHGFNTNTVSIQDDNTCIILLVNAANPNLDKITKDIFVILYNMPYELLKEETAITVPEEIRKQYVGVYDVTAQLIITVTVENGRLMGKPEGQEQLELRPEKEDVFFVSDVEAEVRFNRNDKKEMTGMTILQRGQEMSGKKRWAGFYRNMKREM